MGTVFSWMWLSVMSYIHYCLSSFYVFDFICFPVKLTVDRYKQIEYNLYKYWRTTFTFSCHRSNASASPTWESASCEMNSFLCQVQQVQRERSERSERTEPEGVTLDLSIKKPRECSPSPMASSPMGLRGDSPYHPHHPQHRDSPSLPAHTTLLSIPPPAHKSGLHHPPPPLPPSVTVFRTDTGYYPHQVFESWIAASNFTLFNLLSFQK